MRQNIYKALLLFIFVVSLVSAVAVIINFRYHKLAKIYQSNLDQVRGLISSDIANAITLNALNEQIADHLKIYTAYDETGPINLIRHGSMYDGGYVVPDKALKIADVLLGYGIGDDSVFEEDFSRIYQKPSYGFDCGVNYTKGKEPLFTFVDECIGTDKTLFSSQQSSAKVSTFGQQIDRLKLKGKKIFIKMDIEGGEFQAFEEILGYSNNITGIAVEVHANPNNIENVQKSLKLIKDLEKDFVLLHVHTPNTYSYAFYTTRSIGKIPYLLELTYVNKALVTKYNLSENQKHPTTLDQPANPNLPDASFEILF